VARFSTHSAHSTTAGPSRGSCGVNLLHPLADLDHREVLVTVVHGFELAAIDRNNGTSEEFEPTAKLDELSAYRPENGEGARPDRTAIDSGPCRRGDRIGRCATTIVMSGRIASPEMRVEAELLRHLICSPPVGGGGGFDEADQHGSAR
jgi:hypothetical protein